MKACVRTGALDRVVYLFLVILTGLCFGVSISARADDDPWAQWADSVGWHSDDEIIVSLMTNMQGSGAIDIENVRTGDGFTARYDEEEEWTQIEPVGYQVVERFASTVGQLGQLLRLRDVQPIPPTIKPQPRPITRPPVTRPPATIPPTIVPGRPPVVRPPSGLMLLGALGLTLDIVLMTMTAPVANPPQGFENATYSSGNQLGGTTHTWTRPDGYVMEYYHTRDYVIVTVKYRGRVVDSKKFYK